MNPLGSLRGRLTLALLAVFAIGAIGSGVYYSLEAREVREDLRRLLPAQADQTEIVLRKLYEFDYEYLTYVFVPFAVLAGLVSVGTMYWGLRPILEAGRALNGTSGQSHARLDTDSLPTEIRPFAVSVNFALDRLAEAYETEKRFTANAAHELRTPLSVLALRLQRARLDGSPDWSAIERDLAQLSRLVKQLLDLAQRHSAAVRDEPAQVVNLARVTRETAALALPLAEQRGRAIEVEAPESVTVSGRAEALGDLLRNLLENALLHGSGLVTVKLVVHDQSGPHADLVVMDEGPGIPESLREVIFDRFRKGRADAGGAGLGLSIVREIALAHRARVEFLPTRHCQVRVRFQRCSE